ncbi:CCA tRNA nucleotidyltransferase [candidate division WOR-3 bacterium]|nr:CCA tRNA nucleotidyltransferase [candidate division WOR-3 bacterium]
MRRINFQSELRSVFKEIGQIARKLGYSVYIVGGPVRDILLGRSFQDVDVVCVGNAVKLAKVFSRRVKGEFIYRRRYPNATVKWNNSAKVDFVSARSEVYPKNRIGLPRIRRTKDLLIDLNRRDFTVNAIAVDLNPGTFGNLYDPFNGLLDCQKKLIRVLHPNSFKEDPTRIFRAIRFSMELSFQIEENTKKLLNRDLKFLKQLSQARLWKEIKICLNDGSDVLNYLKKFGVLRVLNFSYPGQGFLERVDVGSIQFDVNPVNTLILALIEKKPARCYSFERSFIQQINYVREINNKALRNIEVVHKLFKLEDYSLLFLFARYPKNSIIIENFFDNREKLKPELNGEDIKKLGVNESPEIGKLMKRIIEGRWIGKISGRNEEVDLVERYLGGKDVSW